LTLFEKINLPGSQGIKNFGNTARKMKNSTRDRFPC
jgi:hypothetical protein